MINDINNEKQKEKMIRELGVFELRAVARQLGVSSPTTKKRDELIELILEASRNGKHLDDNMPKRGRPFKRLNVLDSITNKITRDKISEELSYETVVNFAQEISLPNIENIDDEIYIFAGVIHKSNTNARFFDINTNKLVFITNDNIYFEKITSGDIVKCEVRKLVDQNQFITLNIIEINGVPAEKYDPKFVELGEAVIGNESIPFSNGNIILGRRNIYKLKEDIFESKYFNDLYNECKKQNIHFLILGTNISFENQIMFKKLSYQENFTTVYGSYPDFNLNKVADVINYGYRLLSQGEKVMLFICDIVDVMRSLDQNFDTEVGEEHANKTKVVIHKLMSFAMAYENGISGTIVMGYRENDKDDKLLVNELFKISKII